MANSSPARSREWSAKLTQVALFALAALAVALPWEVFQRLPVSNLTISKLAGLLVVACAVALSFTRRAVRVPRTGIGAPILLLAFLCLVSLAYSVDRPATLRQLAVYASYFAFIFSAATIVQQPGIAAFLLHCYVASTAVLSATTLAAYGGLIWPTSWTTAYSPLQRLILEYRDGVPMRMVAASADFNQGAMLLLVGFVASLFLYNGYAPAMWRRITPHVAQVAIFAAILVSMSRSAVLIAGIFAMYWLFTIPKRRGLAIVVTGAVCAAAFLALTYFSLGFWETFFHRAQGGLAHDDPSIRGRWQVYRIGFALLPQYGLWGCGLGAINTAMAGSRFADEAVMTMHSLPMIYLLEIGIAGFLAYVWLVFRVLKTVRQWSVFATSGGRATARALTAVVLAIVAMTSVQPFPFLPLYPFIIALACGPWNNRLAEQPVEPQKDHVAIWRITKTAAALVVVLIVAANFVKFQQTVSQFAKNADALAAGLEAERATDWPRAIEQYRAAAIYGVDTRSTANDATAAMAWSLVDPDPLLLAMNIPWLKAPLPAVAQFGLGRSLLARGDIPAARTAYESAWTLEPRFDYLRFDLAEALWATGKHTEAINLYVEAAKAPSIGLSESQLELIAVAQSRADALTARRIYSTTDNHWRGLLPARLETLSTAEDEASFLERASILRRLGRWEEAVALYEKVRAAFPNCADASFNLGVASQMDGRVDDAIRFYQDALRASPRHSDASAHLLALNDAVQPQS